MKKIILSLIVVAALSTSCKKNYTCTCTSNNVVVTSYIINGTKSTATTDCTAKGTSNTSYVCTIQ
ncbi:MAG TPA: hypothetical protein VNX01_04990 [Bacteroidia bacterium]|nr:hypothetical protein [Bacteroidia bacterium]